MSDAELRESRNRASVNDTADIYTIFTQLLRLIRHVWEGKARADDEYLNNLFFRLIHHLRQIPGAAFRQVGLDDQLCPPVDSLRADRPNDVLFNTWLQEQFEDCQIVFDQIQRYRIEANLVGMEPSRQVRELVEQVDTSLNPSSGRAPRTSPPDAVHRPLRVFLCHGQEDKATVRELSRMLKDDGFQPWLDEEDLLPGHAGNWRSRRLSARLTSLSFAYQPVQPPEGASRRRRSSWRSTWQMSSPRARSSSSP